MVVLEGLQWHQRFNEHMGCMKGCLDYLGIDITLPWLYGATGHAFVLNMNDAAFVDAAQEWDLSMLYSLAPNLGFTVERFAVPHRVALEMPDDAFRSKQREAWGFVRARIDQGLPCYAWEVAGIPAYYVITGYDDAGYTYSGWESGTCPWEVLGTFNVKQLAVNCVHPGVPAPDRVTIREALAAVLDRIEQPDGWAVGPSYRTGLPAYAMWADALETGRANRDGEAYLNQVWLECREMAIEFLQEAKGRLPGRCEAAFDDAAAHYATARDKLRALSELYPERPDEWEWTTTFASPEGAQLVREAAQAEAQGVACLRQIPKAL